MSKSDNGPVAPHQAFGKENPAATLLATGFRGLATRLRSYASWATEISAWAAKETFLAVRCSAWLGCDSVPSARKSPGRGAGARDVQAKNVVERKLRRPKPLAISDPRFG